MIRRAIAIFATAFAIGGTAGLGVAYATAPSGGPAHEGVHAWVAHAEADALRHLHSMTCPPGHAAEAWAEVNSLMPSGYEIIAECISSAP